MTAFRQLAASAAVAVVVAVWVAAVAPSQASLARFLNQNINN